MIKFTVVSFVEDSGRILCDHVVASGPEDAFSRVAEARDEAVVFVCAMVGHLQEDGAIWFPGESLVDNQTVQEQPDVFGSGSDGFPDV